MAKTNYIASAVADPGFRLRAFSDYTSRKLQAQSDIVKALSTVIDLIVEDADGNSTYPEVEDVRSWLAATFTGITYDSLMLTAKGYVKVGDACMQVIAYQEDIESDDFLNVNMDDVTMIALTPDTQQHIITLSDVIDDATSALHSVCCLDAANVAMTMADKVSDRLSIFRDRISRLYSNPFSEISSTASYLTSLLEQATDASTYLSEVDKALGITDLAADGSATLPEETDISQYTGASPAGPLCFDGVLSAVSTVINIGAKVIGNLFKAGALAVKSLCDKAYNKVYQTVVDPYDIYIKNDSADATDVIDSFAYQFNGFLNNNGQVFTHYNDPLWEDTCKSMAYSSYIQKFVFGELLLKFDEYKFDLDYEVYYDAAFKPKPITREFFISLILPFCTTNNKGFLSLKDDPMYDYQAIAAELSQRIANFDKKYYNPAEDSEEDMYIGFCLGVSAFKIFMRIMQHEWGWFDQSLQFNYPTGLNIATAPLDLKEAVRYETPIPSSITNLDFIKVVSGYDGGNSFNDFSRALLFCSQIDFNLSFVPYVLASNLYTELKTPADFPFLPYRKNAESFSIGKFGIKTDYENQEAFNTFVTTAIVALVVIAVVITAGVAVTKFTRKLRMKRIQQKARLEAKMWDKDAGPLTAKEARKYRKLEKRLDTASRISDGLLGSSESSTTAPSDITQTLLDIRATIVGMPSN